MCQICLSMVVFADRSLTVSAYLAAYLPPQFWVTAVWPGGPLSFIFLTLFGNVR